MNDELPQQYGKGGFVIALAIVGALTVCFALLIKSGMAPPIGAPTASAQIGKEFPPIEAAGWINGDAPSAEDLRGHVLVVDAWAFWCGPCRISAKELVGVYGKYKDRGVTFIGLTSEGEDAVTIRKSQQYVMSLNIPWLNGYAAIKTLLALDVEGIPQLWVVDRQNRIVYREIGWSDNSVRDLETALNKALESSE